MPTQRNGLRKREIAFALAMGAVAAGGAGAMLAAFQDDGPPPIEAFVGPGEMTYEVGEFDQISTAGPQNVVVTFGDAFSVRSEGSPRALALLEATVDNGRLTIGPESGFNWFASGQLEGTTFYVTLPALRSVTTAGSGSVQVDRIEGDRFEGTVGGPGTISIGLLKVDEADLTVTGSGNVVATGDVREARVTIAGSGEIQAGALRSKIASVTIGGSGDVTLAVEEEAKVAVTGSGDVDIAGPASCSVTRMGGGEVRCNGIEMEAN